jgi:hypothetical protein
LDDNQKIANSLVSLLKAVPDPTGISQGSAGAVFLLSRISGDDKSSYAVFRQMIGSRLSKSGKMFEACYAQEIPLNKDAKRLSINKSSCLNNATANLWFGFESSNWIMKQKFFLK